MTTYFALTRNTVSAKNKEMSRKKINLLWENLYCIIFQKMF